MVDVHMLSNSSLATIVVLLFFVNIILLFVLISKTKKELDTHVYTQAIFLVSLDLIKTIKIMKNEMEIPSADTYLNEASKIIDENKHVVIPDEISKLNETPIPDKKDETKPKHLELVYNELTEEGKEQLQRILNELIKK